MRWALPAVEGRLPSEATMRPCREKEGLKGWRPSSPERLAPSRRICRARRSVISVQRRAPHADRGRAMGEIGRVWELPSGRKRWPTRTRGARTGARAPPRRGHAGPTSKATSTLSLGRILREPHLARAPHDRRQAERQHVPRNTLLRYRPAYMLSDDLPEWKLEAREREIPDLVARYKPVQDKS